MMSQNQNLDLAEAQTPLIQDIILEMKKSKIKRKIIIYGKIEGNAPKPLPTREKGPKSTILETKDIEGAQASTKGGRFGVKNNYQNKTSYMNVKDIEGAQASTLQKCKLKS